MILAIESASLPASVALLTDTGDIIGEFYINTNLKHSQTLMYMTEALLKCTNTNINEIKKFAVSAGPGSFTGVRIGISAVKGMALALDTPCVGVSTLDAIAQNFLSINIDKNANHIICCVMDARCKQVYNALYACKNENLTKLCDDRAISIEDLFTELQTIDTDKIIFAGDGADICYDFALESNINKNFSIAPQHLKYQHAHGVAAVALSQNTITADELLPIYLRLPQAERELKKRGTN